MGRKKVESKKKKGAQLIIRVDREERDAFVALCERLDTSAAREIRRFMREWAAANQAEVPAELESSSSKDDEPPPVGGSDETISPETEVEKARKTRRNSKTAA